MSVTTLIDFDAPRKVNKSASVPVVTYVIGVVSIGLLVFFGGEILKNLDNFKSRSAITVDTLNSAAEVSINGKLAGSTPYESSKVKPGDNTITIKSGDLKYETVINFLPNSEKNIHNVGIFRDLGVSDVFSSGQEFWFEKEKSNNTIRIISNPSGAVVFIDGTEIGKTPFVSNSLAEDSYDLEVAYPGYEKQSARINIKKDYTLNVNLKLFPAPTPTPVKPFDETPTLYNIIMENNQIYSDPQKWAKAVVYWNKTRGIELFGVGVNKDVVFDFFIDYKGTIYNKEGNIVKPEEVSTMGDLKRGAYLGRTPDGNGVTEDGRKAYLILTNQPIAATIGGKKATIKATGTGWLRVRGEPTLNGAELAKVNTGTTYEVLEEKPGWTKIKVSDTISGWVSADYVSLN